MTASPPRVGTMPAGTPTLENSTTLARLARPRSPEKTILAVIADPHIATRAENTWKQFDQTERLLTRAVSKVQMMDVDGVVILGDLTKDGELWNFDKYDEIIDPVAAPTVTLPGNHDAPKQFDNHPGQPLEEFRQRYTQSRYPIIKRLDSIELIGLNTAFHPESHLSNSHGGKVSTRQLHRLDQLLSETTTPIVFMHHNLHELPHNPGGDWQNFPVKDPCRLRAILSEHDANIVLSGHQHLVGTHQREGVRELIAPAVCSYPISILTVEIGPSGTTVVIHPLGDSSMQETAYKQAISGNKMGRGIAARAGIALESLPLLNE